MRVLHVTHSYLPRVGGVEHHIRSIATRLAASGIQPHVLTPRWDRESPRTERLDGVDVIREDSFGMMRNVPISPRDPFTVARWLHDMRNLAPDLIHVHGPFSPIFGPPVGWASWSPVRIVQVLGLLQVPVVVTFHGLWAHYTVDPYDRDRKHVRMGSILIGVDRGICRDLAERYRVPPSRVNYIPNGVDTSLFRPGARDAGVLERMGVAETEKMILVPRRIDPKNGIEFAVRAFEQTTRRIPDAKLVLLGFGLGTSDVGYTQKIQSLIRELKLVGKVVSHSGLPFDQMPSAYRSAHMTVIPSLWEATSLAAIESMACGVPVIASRIGGLPDVVDESCGILVPAGDVDALGRAMVRLLTDEDERARLGKGALLRARSLDWSGIAAMTGSVYHRALTARP